MNEKTFFERFTRELNNIREEEEFETLSKAFIFWIGKNYFYLDDNDDIKNRISDGSRDEGIDAIFVDYKNFSINLIHATTVDAFEHTKRTLPETDLKIFFSGFKLITKGDFKGKVNPILEDLVKEYHELLNTNNYVVKVWFFHLNKKPGDLKYVDEFKKEFTDVEVTFVDFETLWDFYDKYLITQEPAPEKVTLEILSDTVRVREPKKALVFTVGGKEIAKVFLTYGSRLFQKNVRYFLGNRSKSINAEIERTAGDPDKSKLFWYYNNGITAICNKIITNPGGKVVTFEKMQIINGAQTTYSLAEAYNKGTLKEDVKVLLKVIEETDNEFIESVTLYTNNQNPIKLRDLCSKDDIQTKIQSILLVYRYFYERKRGEFNSLYETEDIRTKKFGADWKSRIINNEKAAQSYLSFFLNKPAQAKSQKKRIFMKDEAGFYKDIFHPNIVPESMLFSYKLMSEIEKRKKEYNKEYKKAEERSPEEQAKIYEYDFLLHADFFILNLFKDFLKNNGFNFDKDRSLKLVGLIDSGDELIDSIYTKVTELIKEFILPKKDEETYYHNKFFKSDSSIGFIREFLKSEKGLDFVETV